MQRVLAAGGAVRRALQRRSLRASGHGDGGSWFAAGDKDPTGILFNETPPLAGQKRRWEDWELPYYVTGILATIILTVGLNAKPDTNLDSWARKQAEQRLREAGLLEDEANT